MAAYEFDRFASAELRAVRYPDNASAGRVMERLSMHYRGLESWYGVMPAAHVPSQQQRRQRRQAGVV